jgi:hypothetical protein
MCNQTAKLTDSYVLCQECGHVEEYSEARANRQERCSRCGSGFFCGCHCCDGLARMNLQLRIHEQHDNKESDQ